MITYTTFSYNFPFSERYENWLITYDSNTGIMAGEGYKKIIADIQPDFIGLIHFLHKNNFVSGPCIFAIDRYRQFLGLQPFQHEKISTKDMAFLSETKWFCDNELHYTIKHRGYSASESLFGGSKRASDKAIKKIKNDIVVDYPNPARELINHLKAKGLVPSNVNPICDTLSKDI